MPKEVGGPVPDGSLSNVRIYVKCAGGLHGRYILLVEYAPSARGARKRVQSSHPRYGKSWARKEDIGDSDKNDFIHWVNHGLARGGGGKRRAPLERESVRSSTRVDECMMQKHMRVSGMHGSEGMQIEQGVIQCMNSLIMSVIHQARQGGDGVVQKLNFVERKRRHKTEVAVLPSYWPRRRLTKRMKRAKLTQRRARGYAYRVQVLQRAAASRAEADLEWLSIHNNRLATIVARQSLLELLPEGAALRVEHASVTADLTRPSHHF